MPIRTSFSETLDVINALHRLLIAGQYAFPCDLISETGWRCRALLPLQGAPNVCIAFDAKITPIPHSGETSRSNIKRRLSCAQIYLHQAPTDARMGKPHATGRAYHVCTHSMLDALC
jgi:hypothetical protein